MVARINKSSTLSTSLNYNEHKVQQQMAELILAENYAKDAHLLKFDDKLYRLQRQANLNERVKANSVHISLNFHPEEKLDKEKLQDIAKTYMEQIGFGNQPYLVYQHHDAGHPHVHIVTTNITAEGKRIDMNNIGRALSENARKSIAKQFDLISPESKKIKQQFELKEKVSSDYQLEPINARKLQYGKSATKTAIQNVIELVMNQYKYTSLGEYNAVLKLYNVMADPGQKDSLMYKNKGLIYRVLDEVGNKIGTPIKASQFYNKPTFKNLELKFSRNEAQRQPFARQVKTRIDWAILQKNTLEHLSTALQREGISIVARQTVDGSIYGMTFVDHINKCVFNGSDLGRQYSAKAIQERCTPKAEVLRVEHKSMDKKMSESMQINFDSKINIASHEHQSAFFHKHERLVLLETLLKPQPEYNSMPYELRTVKRRKKKKRKGLRL